MTVQNRPNEQACVLDHVGNGECCALVGLSNTGKSTLLRNLTAPGNAMLFYIDCNRMLSLSEQGFYEAILRAVRASLIELQAESGILERLEQDYQQVINPHSKLAVPLGFNDALERLCEGGRPLALILDEFDEPFEALDGRAFLNLRALHDRYGRRLVYVTATAHTLEGIRDDRETGEFREMFVGRVCQLGMLEEEAARTFIAALAEECNLALSEDETRFIFEASGGHPGLAQRITQLLLHARSTAPRTYAQMGTVLVSDALAGHEAIRGECKRLWGQLAPSEQETLTALSLGESPDESRREPLQRLGLVNDEGRLASSTLGAFTRQRHEQQRDLPPGIWLDEDAGEAYVDGRQVPPLTDLEYRLLQSLYRRVGKLCDKYRLVEEVWGEEYIDEVDDARIEKLISRVRAKIEQDPATPRYLVTVRGRGYRLQGQPDE